jgi:lipopolysaccharide heptosyltransferase I
VFSISHQQAKWYNQSFMRILIIKLSSIGDVVHTLPAAAALRRALPEARIAWVVDRRASAILKDSPVIDDLIELDLSRWRNRLLDRATREDARARLAEIRKDCCSGDGFDVAIDFQGLIKSGLIALASGAARRFGFETADLRERASRFFLTEQVATAKIKRVIDKNLALACTAAAALNDVPISCHTPQPRNRLLEPTSWNASYEFPIAVSAEDEQYVDAAINGAGERFAIINPGAGWKTKLWPAERYAQIADWLWEEKRMISFVTYGAGEEELAKAVVMGARSGAAREFASTLKQFVALARRAALFVGADTGPLHLAAASGTPIVGLYGPTLPERNGPFNERDLTLGRDLWCRADCHRRSCWHWECMDISVRDVQRAISLRLEPRS